MTKNFICDSCGQEIEDIKHGWVEWQSGLGLPEKSKGLRLVHHRGIKRTCAYDQDEIHPYILADGSLSEFLGQDGLMQLLEFSGERGFEDGSVLEMIKRLHVDGYEQARFYIKDARSVEAIQMNRPDGYPTQENIAGAIQYSKERDLYE